MPKVYFSLQEANELVKKIRMDVERVGFLVESLELLDNTKVIFDEANMENLMLEVELNKSFHEKNLELYMLLGDLIKKGCVIRDINDIEIDFYSKLKDKDIFLCWKPSEEKIFFWHEMGEQKDKRKPVKSLENSYLNRLERLR